MCCTQTRRNKHEVRLEKNGVLFSFIRHVTKNYHKVYNKYIITLVFLVMALLFRLCGRILPRPTALSANLNKILGSILKTPGNIVYLSNIKVCIEVCTRYRLFYLADIAMNI